MNCGMECIKYILFIFNFIFALGGLGMLVLGVMAYVGYTSTIQTAVGADMTINAPIVTILIAGGIIFIIAFFGCCGAIRESHCMIVTFAVCIMTLLVIQVGVAVWIFKIAGPEKAESHLVKAIDTSMRNYREKQESREFMNAFQVLGKCCGYDSYGDYAKYGNQDIPYSCCGKPDGQTCSSNEVYREGCKTAVPKAFEKYAKIFATSALVVAGIEIVGIIFSLCLASSIRNAERRGYKV